MIEAIIGRKLDMTQIFAGDGVAYPVTLVQVGPCTVTQVKTAQKDGYCALQMGFGTKKAKSVNRPMKGQMDKIGKGYFEVLREVPAQNPSEHNPGDQVLADIFQIGDRVDIIGKSKGKGFAGTIKRWRFSRGPDGHGSKNVREPGSTGMATYPGRVIKGKRMPGQKGNCRTTVLNLKIVDVRPENNLLLVHGAVPGSKNGIVIVRKTNRAK
ncbi:MAG: 50S ribosomal protein L3 [Syntrophobacteraceae bacterium]|nr:50S ribosomal protein L3 [Syntrophobacteraceae bacterium]